MDNNIRAIYINLFATYYYIEPGKLRNVDSLLDIMNTTDYKSSAMIFVREFLNKYKAKHE